jgi:ribonuclease P protein component
MRKSLTRRERLRKSSDVKGLFRSGRRVEAEGTRLLYRMNGTPVNRFAVIVRRGCGGAVKRNRERRITREAYRELKPNLRRGYDLLFIVDRFGQGFKERQTAMRKLSLMANLCDRMDSKQ